MTLSLNQILRNDIQESLEGSESVLIKSIMDLSSSVGEGMDRVTIPKVAGLQLKDVKTDGSDQTGSGATQTSSVLLLDQSKEVPDYIYEKDGVQSAIDMEKSFLDNSPAIFAGGVEGIIAAKLVTASSLDFDSASTTAGVFAIADIAKAKKLLDKNKIPKTDRYMAVNAEGMEILSSMQEFQDGAKSLSAEALREGVVSQVKGFKVIQSEDIPGTGATLKVCFYHKSAVAFALQNNVRFIKEAQESKGRTFISLRGLYGCVDCDNTAGAGKRKITMSCTTAAA